MNITVTKEDIEQGQRRDPEQCAIALALLRAGLEHFGVMGPSVMVADSWGRLTSLKLPEVVSDWIFNFDAGNTVAPFSFEVALPQPMHGRDSSNAHQTREIVFTPAPELLSVPPLHTKPLKRGRGGLKVPKLGSKRHRRLRFSLQTS